MAIRSGLEGDHNLAKEERASRVGLCDCQVGHTYNQEQT